MKSTAIKRLRKRLGDTQHELGERCGVTRQCVSLWESGERTPSGSAVVILRQLAKTCRECSKSS